MSQRVSTFIDRPKIVYPETDGQPMAENTLQFRWIVTIEGGLEGLFAKDPNVFVAGDLFWYPVEGHPEIHQAPDTLVVFGRPKGDRGSYRQWVEGGIAPQVVFEVLSPGNRAGELARKFEFYERYGVEEYYIFDPDERELSGWTRKGDRLQEIASMEGWCSPRLQIRFEMVSGDLRLFRPDGKPFATFQELMEQIEKAQHDKEQAERDKEQAERDKEQAERDKEQAERDKEQAERDKEQAERDKERLIAQLRAHGIEPE